MSTLIIYDGWQQLKLIHVVRVIVGPVVAMFIGHVFSASLAKQVEIGRSLTWSDRVTPPNRDQMNLRCRGVVGHAAPGTT